MASRLTAMTNNALAEATWALAEIGDVLKPVIRTEPADQLVRELFPDREALEHAAHLVVMLSNPSALHQILRMESWDLEAYEEWLDKYGKPLPRLDDPVPEGLKPYLPVNCPHDSPPMVFGPPGEIRHEQLAKATVKTKDSDESSSSSSSEESSEEEEGDKFGMCFVL